MTSSSNHDRTSDHGIIGDIRKNDRNRQQAEDELFKRYSYFVREGISKYNMSEEDSFDAYSDTILSAIEKISNGTFEGRSSLKTYLYRIFHNKCVDLLRKSTTNKNSVHRTSSISDVLLYLSDAAKSVIEKLADRSEIEEVSRKLDELGTNCKELLWKWADGYSDKEIATELEYKTASVVKTSRLRCLDKLRQLCRKKNNDL